MNLIIASSIVTFVPGTRYFCEVAQTWFSRGSILLCQDVLILSGGIHESNDVVAQIETDMKGVVGRPSRDSD